MVTYIVWLSYTTTDCSVKYRRAIQPAASHCSTSPNSMAPSRQPGTWFDSQLAAAAAAAAWSRVTSFIRQELFVTIIFPRHREMLVIAAVGFYEHRKKEFIQRCVLFTLRIWSDRRTCRFLPTCPATAHACSDGVQINKQSSHCKIKLTVYEIVYNVRQST